MSTPDHQQVSRLVNELSLNPSGWSFGRRLAGWFITATLTAVGVLAGNLVGVWFGWWQ